MLLGQLDQIALFVVSGGDDVLLPAFAHFLLEHFRNDQILAHGLGGSTGLGDDVEAGALYVDDVHQSGHALGGDVVFHIQTGAAALFSGQFVIMKMIESLLDGDGAQRAAADTQHHKRVKLIADARGHSFDLLYDFLLIIGQLRPAQPAGAAILCHIMLSGGGSLRHAVHMVSVDPVLETDNIAHHVVDVQNDRFMIDLCHNPVHPFQMGYP